MDRLVSLALSSWSLRCDDDFVDRLSHRYTVVILVVFATIISTSQYVGTPISCWVPAEYTSSHKKYTNTYCWIRNTYYLPFEQEIPKKDEPRHMIIYYQWIPFIFLIQAVLFYAPTIIWHSLNSKAGIDSDNIMAVAAKLQLTEGEDKKADLLKLLVNQMHRFLHSKQDKVAKWKISIKNMFNLLFCGRCGKQMGSYLVILFTISKVMYVVNVVAQLFLLGEIFQTNYGTFGLDFFNITKRAQNAMPGTPAFPRITMCDLQVRTLGNLQPRTVQCILPLNLYMELMYVFIWFWMVFIAIATLLSMATWILRFIYRKDRVQFLLNHIVVLDLPDDTNFRQLVDSFLDEYLQQDGAFLLRLIAHNTNNITTTEVICALWEHWTSSMAPLSPGLQTKGPHSLGLTHRKAVNEKAGYFNNAYSHDSYM